MAGEQSHDCPRQGCGRRVPSHMLACARHWYQVPKPLRLAVWAAWNNGAGAGTMAHRGAIDAAISAMNRAPL